MRDTLRKTNKKLTDYTMRLPQKRASVYFTENKNHRLLSPKMCEAWRWIDRHTAQLHLACDNQLSDISSLEMLIKNTDSEIKLISDYCKILYRDIDSFHDPNERAKLPAKRADCTNALTQLLKDKKMVASSKWS
jgi:hypothetical protein